MGIIFWPWAIYNTFELRDDSHSVHMGLDFGMISFVPLLFAGIYGLSSVVRQGHNTVKSNFAKGHLILTPIGHVLVTINYIAGAILAPTDKYRLYCYVFTVMFGLTGIIFTILAYKWKKSFEGLDYNKPLDMNFSLNH